MRILTFIIFLCSTIYNISCFNYKDGLLWKAEEVDFISTQCQESIKLFKENLCTNGQDDIWALQMLDASSKIPIGILSYNFGELGNFNQCLKIKSKNYVIMGKYCLGNIAVNTSAIDEDSIYIKSHMYMKTVLTKITVGIKLNGNPTMAICIPSNCTDDDAKKLMSSPELGVSVQSVICQTIENVYPELTKEAIVAISVLSTLILIVILSTACDLLYSNKIENSHPILLAFSLYANGKKLFKIPRRSSNLSSLDGLRVMSMVWIIMLHSHSVYTSGPVSNAKDIVNFTNSFMSMIFINGDLACDTFLIIGGTLITFVYFKRQNIHKGNYKMSVSVVLKHYLHRYLRLTPPLAGVVFVSATLLRYMGSGPKWPYIVNNFEENCKVYWWSALLYIQNIFNVDRMCVGHSWYLNVDMQLYFFSPLILWLLKERTKTGIGILIFTSLLSMSVSFIRGYVEELSGVRSTYYSRSSSDVYMNTYYLKTETRATPWLMGIILGYILSGKKYTEIRLSKKIIFPVWFLSLGVMLTCVFGGHNTLRRPEYFRLQNAFYLAMVRPSFALSVAWVIWACSTNHGGVINKLLSLPIFQFLNKFIYSMYLLHVTILYMIVFASKGPMYFSVFYLSYWFWGIFMLSFGLSIIWVLVFESPMMAIEKIIFSS